MSNISYILDSVGRRLLRELVRNCRETYTYTELKNLYDVGLAQLTRE